MAGNADADSIEGLARCPCGSWNTIQIDGDTYRCLRCGRDFKRPLQAARGIVNGIILTCFAVIIGFGIWIAIVKW